MELLWENIPSRREEVAGRRTVLRVTPLTGTITLEAWEEL